MLLGFKSLLEKVLDRHWGQLFIWENDPYYRNYQAYLFDSEFPLFFLFSTPALCMEFFPTVINSITCHSHVDTHMHAHLQTQDQWDASHGQWLPYPSKSHRAWLLGAEQQTCEKKISLTKSLAETQTLNSVV